MATCSSILAWKILWTEDLEGYNPWRYKELDTTPCAKVVTLALSLAWGRVSLILSTLSKCLLST